MKSYQIYELNILYFHEIFIKQELYEKSISILKGILTDFNMGSRFSQLGFIAQFLIKIDYSKIKELSDSILGPIFKIKGSNDYNSFLKYSNELIESEPSGDLTIFLVWVFLSKVFKQLKDMYHPMFTSVIKSNSIRISNFLSELQKIHSLKYHDGFIKTITPEEWEEIRNSKKEKDNNNTEELPQ